MTKMKRLFTLFLALVMVASLLAACGGNSEAPAVEAPAADAPAAEAPATEAPKSDEPIVLNMSMNSAWADLIPYNQSTGGNYSILVLSLIYDRLYAYDADGNIVPRAADSWEIGEDKMSCTFHLNKNAKWHDGEPVTAEDYVFAAEMITDPANGCNSKSHYYIMKGTDTSGIADGTGLGVEAIDDYTVKYYFDEIISEDVTFRLYLQAYMPLPKHLLENVDPADYLTCDLWNHPIGSGPLKFESTIPGSNLTLVANEDYHLGAPKFDQLNITVMNGDSAVTALLSGDIDVMYPAPSRENFLAMEGSDILSYYYAKYPTNQRCLYINNKFGIDKRVRQAVDKAVDRESIAAMIGDAIPIETPVQVGSEYLDPECTYTYDPEAAKAILADAIADGAYDPSEPLLIVTSGSAGEKLCALVEQNLEAVGFNIEVQMMEAATMFAGFTDGSVTMGTVSKDSNFNPLYMRTALTNKRSSYIGWQTELWDDIATEFMNAANHEEEIAIMKKFQETWIDEVPSIFLCAAYSNYAYNNRLGDGESLGLENAAYGCLPVWEWNVKG